MKQIWPGTGEVGIAKDDEKGILTLFAGQAAIELNRDGKVVLSGTISEINGGDRQEEILLQKQAGFMALIPSTMMTPIPQATPRLPFGEVTGMLADIAKMLSMLG